MNIRLAEEKDIDSVIKLLTQVLNIHAKISFKRIVTT